MRRHPAPSRMAQVIGETMTDPSRGSDEGLVDMETLKTRCLGNAALLERVLQTFTAQLDADLRQLQQAFSTGDTDACAKLSHRIKGMAANVEARSLSRHAASAEQCARANSLSELSEQLDSYAAGPPSPDEFARSLLRRQRQLISAAGRDCALRKQHACACS